MTDYCEQGYKHPRSLETSRECLAQVNAHQLFKTVMCQRSISLAMLARGRACRDRCSKNVELLSQDVNIYFRKWNYMFD
jgi:hypothetical protein